MDFSEEQKQALERWIKEGYSLSDIQKALLSEFGVSMTYMEVRLLVLDAGLAVQDKKEKKPEPNVEAQDADGGASPDGAPAVPQDGGVSVDVDRITRPGTIVSGSVTFSDGKSGTWSLDQFGRLALDVGDPAYVPVEEDIALFQQKLKDALGRRGF